MVPILDPIKFQILNEMLNPVPINSRDPNSVPGLRSLDGLPSLYTSKECKEFLLLHGPRWLVKNNLFEYGTMEGVFILG